SSSGCLTAMLSGADYARISLSFEASDGSIPALADYDCDGLPDPAVYDPSSGQFLIRLSDSDYALIAYDLGGEGCLPAPLDYDGDGLADPAVYEPAAGIWSLRLSDSNYELTTLTVAPGGVPVW
ncbi:MAG: hypothetical protein Q8O57_00735, partial [Kiritimatiellota bacterium]|nr:hypothetical protein [Kiritimatiellota bacterium]